MPNERLLKALVLLLSGIHCATSLADSNCQDLLRVPQTPIGRTAPAVYGVGANVTYIGNASPPQEFCCRRGVVDFWRFSKAEETGFVGSLSANCTDGSNLPTITYGYNGTTNCSAALFNESVVSNQGYKRLGNFSFRSDFDLVLASFLDFQPNDAFFDCGKFLAPVGFSASSSCLGVTNFQVICGQPVAEPSCPANSIYVPSSPLGSPGPVELGQDNYTEYTSSASRAVTHCCDRGGIQSWTIARTGHLFFGPGQHSSVGSVSAQCSDGTLLPPVIYGYNGTMGNCTVLLNQSQTVANPYSNQFFYSAGAFLDGFISFGAPNPPDTPYFACNTSQVAVGYRAASNCLALTTFQIVCGTPNAVIRPAMPKGGKEDLTAGQKAGISIAVSACGVLLIGLLIRLIHRGKKRRYRLKERSIELDGDGYIALTNLSELRTAELVDITELRYRRTRTPLVLKPAALALQADSIIRVQLPDQPDTLVFEGEEGDLSIPPNQTSQALHELWQIQAADLKCKRKPNGELFILGTGGSGSVYLGVLLGTTDVAIKVIDSPSPEDQKRFEREVMLLKACRHPNVIQFLGASQLADQTLLVMEFMYGGDLFNQLRKDSFGTLMWNKRGRNIALDVAKGLTYLHSHNILHLDIKSPNILLNNAGAKISDIGLGRTISNDGTTTKQILHEPCTSATDVYALGSVLWELCTGEVPTRLRQFRPPKVPEEAPPEIAVLFSRCHSKNPRQRPTAAEAHAIILESRQSSEMTSVSVNHLVRV